MTVKDSFKIESKSTFTSDDFKVLSLLYQPLIGSISYTLFHTLYHLGHSNEYKHQYLLDLLNIKINDFLESRYKLEALALLDVYQNEDNKYIYAIKKPLTFKEFVSDSLLGGYLESEIGARDLKKIQALFKKEYIDKSAYQNITKQFDDIYETKEIDILEPTNDLTGRNIDSHPKINDVFSYEDFINKVSGRTKKTQLLNQKIKDTLQRLAFIYQFNIDDILSVYNEAKDNSGNIDCKVLKNTARIYYQRNNLSDNPTVLLKGNDNIDTLEKTPPKVVLQQFSSVKVTAFELAEIDLIIEKTGISFGYLNILLQFVLKHKDGIMPTANYFEKVINSWQKMGIMNTASALEYVTNYENRHQNNYYGPRKEKSRKIEPDWFDDYLKELDEGVNNA